jgi:hypothetical protein
MTMYRPKWPLGTEARLMFDILHYTFLRLGDAHRSGPPHLHKIVRKMAVQITTEKGRGNTTVTLPVHPKFAAPQRRDIHRQDCTPSRSADEEGTGGQVQEIRDPGRRQ